MITKILAVFALVTLPLSVLLWHKSHECPEHYRYDVTPYKSLRIHLRDGVCAFRLLSMPTKTAGKSEFQGSLNYNPIPQSLMLSSVRDGPYRITWFVFPFWLPTSLLVFLGVFPIIRGPVRLWWRQWHGLCAECGYNLKYNRSGRCPECGTRFRWTRADFTRDRAR